MVAMGNSNTSSDGIDESVEESSEAARYIEAFVLCVIIVAAVVGNISIWIIILTTRPLRTITNMFILGLSAADLLVSIANMPLTVVSIFTREWPLSGGACVVFGYINMLTLVTSVMSLCNISINRYFMVCRPSKFKDIYTKRNAIFMITGVVSLSIILSAPPLFGWGEYAYIPVQSFCFCDWANHLSYAIFMITCCFGGPCSVMTVCNTFIYRAVRASRRKVAIRIPEASSAAREQEKAQLENEHKRSSTESESLKRSPSECNSENKLIETNASLKRESNKNDNSEKVYESDFAKKNDACVEAEDNNNTKVAKIKVKSKNFLHPLWSIKRRQKRVNALNTIVGDELDISDVETSANDVTFENTNDQSKNRISNTSSSINVPHQSPSTKSAKLKRKEEHRLAMSLIVVVIVFVICWLPFCISMLIMIFADTSVPREFHMCTLLLGYANSCCNPIIYGLMNKRFASGFKDLYCCWKKRSFRMPVLSSP